MSGPLELHRTLAIDVDAAGLAQLRRDVRDHFGELERRRAASQLSANDLAEELASRLAILLDGMEGASPDHRAAIVGAARYFVAAHDDVPDELEGGLDDDVDVFNHVARLIGRPDVVIARGPR